MKKPKYHESNNWIEFYGESSGNLCGRTCGLNW